MLNEILSQAPVFLLIFARIFAMLLVLPMFSMRSASRVAKVALAGYMAFFIFGTCDLSYYLPYIAQDGSFSMEYFLILIGEVLIGIILGFFITMIFSAFSTAGQFLAFQMGFSAASSYDSLSQVENPLMGQFFNLIAMLVFMQTHWFQKLFLQGLVTSFSSLNAISIVQSTESIVKFVMSGLSSLFVDALVISLPVMGSLFLISICTGLLTKAAPQMNLLSEGFPIMIMLAFVIIAFILPDMIDFFVRSFEKGFADLFDFFKNVSGGV
ncbi:MAG: flagellar biosynthetic protein FliR [Spirochaetales bacterium]|nr:flagellar biosynthetic protein FliR [Spirochaetales bacterium]MDY5913779.1 flagellar biosynthetic protein FliR [Treponema sp.]